MNAPSPAGLQGVMKGVGNSSSAADLCRNILRLGWNISESKAWQFLANSGLFRDSSSFKKRPSRGKTAGISLTCSRSGSAEKLSKVWFAC